MKNVLAGSSLKIGSAVDMLVKDVYEFDSIEGKNSVVDVLKDVSGDISNAIKTTPNLASRVTQAVMDVRNGRMGQEGIAQRIGNMLGGTRVLGDLGKKVGTTVGNALGIDSALTNQVMSVVTDALGNPQSFRMNNFGSFGGFGMSDFSSANQITRAIQGFLGNKDLLQVFDLGAEAALIGSLLDQAVRAGIPSAVDILLREAKTDEQRRGILTRNLGAVLYSGDLYTMETSLRHTSPSTIASARPTFAADFLGNFKLPYGTKKSEYLDYKNRVITLLNTINANWAIGLRNGQTIGTLDPFARISSDAKMIFQEDTRYRTQSIIASKFTAQSAVGILKRQYPYMPI